MTKLGNGECDTACSRAECNWDYRDCECANVLDECSGARTDGSEMSTHYNDNTDLCWLIRPKRQQALVGGTMRASRVHLSWTRFDTEALYDKVFVHDGKSELDPILNPGGYSGSALPPAVSSTGGELMIRFVADLSNANERGFRFKWECDALIPTVYADGRASENLLVNPAFVQMPNRSLEGWHVVVNGGDGYAARESLQLDGGCCDITPQEGSQFIATSSGWFVREQEVDLCATGLLPGFLDRAPNITVSERFAQLPDGSASEGQANQSDRFFLAVELLDSRRNTIVRWGPAGPPPGDNSNAAGAGEEDEEHERWWSFSPDQAATCSKSCELSRAGGSPFWSVRRHTFSAYGVGVRYVRWRDGGRDGGDFSRQFGALLDAPSLTVDLLGFVGAAEEAKRTCDACGEHGSCDVSGSCVCDTGWYGASCAARVAACVGEDCAGHGVCVLRGEPPTAGCECDEGWVGRQCTAPSPEVPGHRCTEAGGPRSYHRGINLTLVTHEARRGDLHYGDGRIPLVEDGIVSPGWLGSLDSQKSQVELTTLVPPLRKEWNSDNITLSVSSLEPLQVGVPSVRIDKDSVLLVEPTQHLDTWSALQYTRQGVGVFEPHDPSVQLSRSSAPLDIRIKYVCKRVGTARLALTIPMPGYCSLNLTYEKRCSQEAVDASRGGGRGGDGGGGGGGGGWLLWLLLIAAGCCFCTCSGAARRPRRPYSHEPDRQPVLGHMANPRMRPVNEDEPARAWTLKDVQYVGYGLYSQLRQIADELAGGDLRLRDLPARLRFAMSVPLRDVAHDAQEMQDML